jgi:hypothetical protein
MQTINRIILDLTLAAVVFFAAALSPAKGQEPGAIVINEFLASNTTSILDPDYNQYADWIELYNPGATAIDLGNCCLTDNLAHPKRWAFPSGTSIKAGGFLLIWADGMDTANDGLHTNFKLDKAGESIGLFNNTSLPIDTLNYSKQVSDVAYGRNGSNLTEWLYFSQPTPGTANTTPGLATKSQSQPPAFSLTSGFYSGTQTITLSSTNGGTIRYTLDGSIPSEQSTAYSSPLAVTGNTVLKARVYEPERLPGPVLTRTYFINEQTTLPVISLTTDPDNLWSDAIGIYNDRNIADRKEWERPAHIELFETNGRCGFSVDADIRLFGRTGIYIPEKSLSFFLADELDYPLFGKEGLQRFYSFVLRSSSDDWHLTMFRDGFIQTMVEQNLNVDTQDYRPALLFINGEYWGIHNIREKYNEDYLAVRYGADPHNLDLLYLDLRPTGGVEVDAGDRQQYDALINFIETHNLASQSNYDIFAGMIDIDNLIDYVIAESYTGNTSWAHNIRMWRPRTSDGKWQYLFYDADRGFRDQSYNALDNMASLLQPFGALLDNQNFRQRFVQRFAEYMNDGLNPDRVTFVLDSLQAGIAAEIQRHSDRWKNECGNNVCGIPSVSSWEGSVATMRNIVQERPGIVQQQIINLFDLTGTAQLDIQVLPSGYGSVDLGEKTSINQSYHGTFFSTMSINLTAQPNNGYHFVGWQEASSSSSTILPSGSTWKYYDGGNLPDASWNLSDFNDSSWKSGPAQLGYGDGDEATTVSYGPNSGNKYVTTYFRTSFQTADVSAIQGLTLKLLRDDGAIVYLNGHEVARSNMPAGVVGYDTYASSSVGGADESSFFEFAVDPDYLVQGSNVLAVEVHQSDGSSSDISFDLQLDGLSAGNDGDGYISTNPEFSALLDQNLTLTAVFAVNTQNQLPAEISQNTILTAANSPYIALSDVTVRPNVALSMEPGAEIQLAEDVNIYINGQLSATGSQNLPITIRGIGTNGRWGALCFENATGPSTLAYVKLNGATTGSDATHFKAAISSYESDITLDYANIQNVQQPFYAHGGMIVITNSTMDGTGAGDDIVNVQYASARIENCHLFGNGELDFDSVNDGIIRNNHINIISTNSNRDGIDIGASKNVLIENNRVFDCPDKGISVGEKSTDTIIRGNLVVNTSMAVAVKDSSTASIDRNTFYDDSVGVACYEKVANQGGGFATVSNTIFTATTAAEFTVDEKSAVQIVYSISDKNLIDGLGNIQGDPRFISAGSYNFNLHADSPCIDAGDPGSPNDPDGTRADMGAFFYNQGPSDYSNICINEFMAANTRTIADNAGEYDDWIEIYNKGDLPVDLGGLYMTDNFNNPSAWQIPNTKPDSTTIQPGQFLIFWADGDIYQGVTHLGFQLSANGEQLALFQFDADTFAYVDSVSFGHQSDDVSYGRSEDGGNLWGTFNIPTPGSSNIGINSLTSENRLQMPKMFAVYQNYPNPFNPTTTIAFDLPQTAKVTIDIYDLLGRHVIRIMQEAKSAGRYQIEWQGRDDTGHTVTSGLYFYKITAGKWTSTRKMILMR